MRSIILAAVLAVANPAFATGPVTWNLGGKLNVHSLGAAASGGTTYSGVSGMAERVRPGVSWARSNAHNDFSIGSFSTLCSYCGATAITGAHGSSNSYGSATVGVGNNGRVDPVARYSANGGGYADTVVLREFQFIIRGDAGNDFTFEQ